MFAGFDEVWAISMNGSSVGTTLAVLLALALVTALAFPGAPRAQPHEYVEDPRTEAPALRQKPRSRMAEQRKMVRAIQKGRLRAARNVLAHLLRYQAYAVYTHRTRLTNKLRVRINEQRATIRSITRNSE